jgi:hypothetical protein
MEFWQYGDGFAYTQDRAVIWGLRPNQALHGPPGDACRATSSTSDY